MRFLKGFVGLWVLMYVFICVCVSGRVCMCKLVFSESHIVKYRLKERVKMNCKCPQFWFSQPPVLKPCQKSPCPLKYLWHTFWFWVISQMFEGLNGPENCVCTSSQRSKSASCFTHQKVVMFISTSSTLLISIEIWPQMNSSDPPHLLGLSIENWIILFLLKNIYTCTRATKILGFPLFFSHSAFSGSVLATVNVACGLPKVHCRAPAGLNSETSVRVCFRKGDVKERSWSLMVSRCFNTSHVVRVSWISYRFRDFKY